MIKKIEDAAMPLTISSLKTAFKQLGVEPGMTILLHSSLSSLGWVCGGAVAVILDIEEILGEQATLVMPTFSTNLSDPSKWQNPPVPESWWDTIRQEMPCYDPELTPTRGVGVIPETFRKQRGIIRSTHPHISFAARGRQAKYITENYALNYPFGDNPPLGRIYELDGWVMLMGTNYNTNSSFHLAEYRAKYPGKIVEYHHAPIKVNNCRQWLNMEDFNSFDNNFNKIGASFERDFPEKTRIATIGKAVTKLIRQRDIVDYAVAWLSNNTNPLKTSALLS